MLLNGNSWITKVFLAFDLQSNMVKKSASEDEILRAERLYEKLCLFNLVIFCIFIVIASFGIGYD